MKRAACEQREAELARNPAKECYESWEQISGYFDGDGNVGVEVVKYVLRFKLRFSDTWKPQIEAVRGFLVDEGIATSGLYHEPHPEKRDAYRIDVVAIQSVLKAARAMLPYCAKKAEDLRIVVDYLEGRISGSQALERFNHEVNIGRRSGYIRRPNLPYTRQDGLRMAQLENARNARAAYAVNVSGRVQDSIRKDHRDLKLGHIRLSKKYGYSVSVIRRILGAR
ncbi:MAG: hypothetical protein KGI38_06765 [Thaumarchaeota archaeon]|nr:hypothetical protein [Nitrososphaerota archaeon]